MPEHLEDRSLEIIKGSVLDAGRHVRTLQHGAWNNLSLLQPICVYIHPSLEDTRHGWRAATIPLITPCWG